MREGVWVEEPTLGQEFSFVCDNGDIIRTAVIRKIIDSPEDISMIDSWDRDFYIEKTGEKTVGEL